MHNTDETHRATQNSNVAGKLNGSCQAVTAIFSSGRDKMFETEIRCFVDSKGNVLPVEVPVTTAQPSTVSTEII